MTFSGNLQPINKSTKRTDFFTYNEKKETFKLYVLPLIPIIGLIAVLVYAYKNEDLLSHSKRPNIVFACFCIQLISFFGCLLMLPLFLSKNC